MRFYTTAELAKLAGVTRVTIFRRIKKGKIKVERVGRSYVISESEVRRLVPVPEDREQTNLELGAAVKKVVREYGDTLKKLGSE